MATGTSIDDLRGVYQHLSQLDLGLHRGGLSAERRRVLWVDLDQDPLVKSLSASDSTPASVRSKVTEDLLVVRELRERAFADPDTYCASSIYEALLVLFFFTVEGDDFVYRGHLDATWRLIPSFYRAQPRISLMLLAKTIYGAYRYLERELGHPLTLTPFEAEAVAQHYGRQTTLLDVTESLRVAAYFATTPLRDVDKQADYGSLYVLGANDLAQAGRAVLRATSLPVTFSRVHQTKGAFVSGLAYADVPHPKPVESAADIVNWINTAAKGMSTVDEMGLGIEVALQTHGSQESAIVKFRQTGEQFSDPDWGVSREQFSIRSAASEQ
jgi:hypothetical protein